MTENYLCQTMPKFSEVCETVHNCIRNKIIFIFNSWKLCDYDKLCKSVPHCSKLCQSVINLYKMSETYLLGHSLAQFYTVKHTYARLSTKIIFTRDYRSNRKRYGVDVPITAQVNINWKYIIGKLYDNYIKK